MAITRRQWLGGLASTAAAQTIEKPPKVRTRPTICLFSAHLPRLQYTELGGALSGLGFEGCDLAVRAGGHVEPERAPADLLRAIEGLRGEGLDVPMITTAFLSAAEPWARSVIGISGTLGVPLFAPGYWRYTASGDVETRLAEVRREIAGFASLGRTYDIALGVPNRAGEFVGQAIWDTRVMISDLDPRWVGYYFDPAYAAAEGAAGGWLVAMKLALPRIKMVSLRDFQWTRDASGKWTIAMCPMGEGVVDWPQVFALLARARFTGPLSLKLDYQPKDELAALSRDLAFVKKHVAAAYGVNIA
jgi:L-ribulose-5-phosphate 3-epimerase